MVSTLLSVGLISLFSSNTFALPLTETAMHSTSPVVPVKWLSTNLENPDLVVVDIRPESAYAASHVPHSISLPWTTTALWTTSVPDNTLIMPNASTITSTMSAQGLLKHREIVLVTDTATLPVQIAQGTRAAATLRYAGMPVGHVGILNGGLAAWKEAGEQLSTDVGAPQAGDFTPEVDNSFIVERAYVHSSIGKASQGTVLIDARAQADYDRGHIESAFSLPATLLWDAGGVWKAKGELEALFRKAVGEVSFGKERGEVVVYCRTGLLASTWFYALSRVLGYENVKLYDGSVEDWIKEFELVPSGRD